MKLGKKILLLPITISMCLLFLIIFLVLILTSFIAVFLPSKYSEGVDTVLNTLYETLKKITMQ